MRKESLENSTEHLEDRRDNGKQRILICANGMRDQVVLGITKLKTLIRTTDRNLWGEMNVLMLNSACRRKMQHLHERNNLQASFAISFTSVVKCCYSTVGM